MSISSIPQLTSAGVQSACNDAIIALMQGKAADQTYGGTLIKDDFLDNAKTNRSPNYCLYDGQLRQVRPTWIDDNGTTSVANNKMTFQTTEKAHCDIELTSTPDLTPTYWEFRFAYLTTPTTGATDFLLIWLNSTHGLRVENDIDAGTLKVISQDTSETDVISTDDIADTDEHTIKVTRDSSGNYELFIDGSSIDTGTDTYVPNGHYFKISNETDQSLSLRELLVKKIISS